MNSEYNLRLRWFLFYNADIQKFDNNNSITHKYNAKQFIKDIARMFYDTIMKNFIGRNESFFVLKSTTAIVSFISEATWIFSIGLRK